ETLYDPKSNFTSLRPKFLYYNPNRIVEVLKRSEYGLELQAAEQSDFDDVSSSSQGDDCSTNEEESITEKGPSEHDESEVEIEEEEEKNGKFWNFYQ
ncbi:hypothetical protein MKX03_025932, partial [Papaver bracteatum]